MTRRGWHQAEIAIEEGELGEKNRVWVLARRPEAGDRAGTGAV
ncbi:hypothetical protein [Amycolatopsis thermoflava]